MLRPAAAVVTDAPTFDQAWLDRLFDAACKEQQFIIYDFERLAGCLTSDEYRQFVHLLERSAAPHRAAPDAVRLASAVLEARIGYRPRVVEIEHPTRNHHSARMRASIDLMRAEIGGPGGKSQP